MRHPFQNQPAFVPLGIEGAAAFDSLIDAALAEDVGAGDVTTMSTIDASATSRGEVVARSGGVVAGLAVAVSVFLRLDPSVDASLCVADGDRVRAGAALTRIGGPARALLTGERVALNFLGRLSGIATLTRQYVDAVAHYGARIADTRKTTPGLRALERYAVRAGGGVNHRFGLHDAVLIKDNHLEAVGSVGEAVRRARTHAPDAIVEVECENVDQVGEAVAAGADAVLLDNMDLETMRRAVAAARGKAIVEASGGITLAGVADIAATGVDVISVGALTHSAPNLDVALDFAPHPVIPM